METQNCEFVDILSIDDWLLCVSRFFFSSSKGQTALFKVEHSANRQEDDAENWFVDYKNKKE